MPRDSSGLDKLPIDAENNEATEEKDLGGLATRGPKAAVADATSMVTGGPPFIKEVSVEPVFDPSAGNHVKGIPLSDKAFLVVTNFNQLKGFMRDPEILQPNAKRAGYNAEELEDEAGVHDLIQRALAGNKRSNVPKYQDYIADVVMGRRDGVLPPMHLWSPDQLRSVSFEKDQFLVVPHGSYLLAIDGETQLSAHFHLNRSAVDAETRQKHGIFPVPAMIHHGISVKVARQYFHDLNVLAVRPSTSLGLSMDTHDPLVRLIEEVEVSVDFLRGRVDKQARQLRRNSSKVITMQTLRQMIINIARGMSGTQYGARPAPVEDLDLSDLKLVAEDWLTAFFNSFGTQIQDREHYLVSASPVLAAVGAMGNEVLRAQPSDRSHERNRLLASLQGVDWRKGERWSGIAGRVNEKKGNFVVGGTKEVAYAVFNVLSNPDNDGYRRVRGAAAELVAVSS